MLPQHCSIVFFLPSPPFSLPLNWDFIYHPFLSNIGLAALAKPNVLVAWAQIDGCVILREYPNVPKAVFFNFVDRTVTDGMNSLLIN